MLELLSCILFCRTHLIELFVLKASRKKEGETLLGESAETCSIFAFIYTRIVV
jgi:hypothetical protein